MLLGVEFVASESSAEVCFSDVGVFDGIPGRPFGQYVTLIDDIGAVDNFQSALDMMVGT